MVDAYCHLDMGHPDPIGDLAGRMLTAGVASALLVETWDGANRALLEGLLRNGPADRLRIALCYRPEKADSLRQWLDRGALTGVRMSTKHIAEAADVCGEIGGAGALLIAHAESGVGALREAIARMRNRFPQTRIYVPHLGWPPEAGAAAADWDRAIREFAAIPSLLLGISAIAHFSRRPFPHDDVRVRALAAISRMPATRLAIASDYPLFEKDRYSEYMSLARDWVTSIHPGWSFAF